MEGSGHAQERNVRGRPVARCARIARTLAVAMAAAILGASALAQAPADKYPEKPIKIIVPFAPGGSVDILARVIGQKLTENWRQPVIVESRPGAGTMIGTQAAAKADPDGYTLIIVVSNHATNPALHATMPYDALKDFEPISLLARAPTNVKELVAAAKEKPGTINFGSAGPGSMTHLVAEMFKLQAGIVMQIPLTFATVTQALPQYQSGLVRALGV